MPTLILSARQTDDAQLLWRACLVANWNVIRLHDWHVPVIPDPEVAVYGEPLFARHVAHGLRLKLQEPPLEWLPELSPAWRGRSIQLTTLAKARNVSTQCFIKPAGEKSFDASVYLNGGDLPAPNLLPDDLPVLVQEVVVWEVEFRCFVLGRKVVTLSPYWRDGRSARADDGSWPASEAEMNEAKVFCERFLADSSVSILPAVVIDVGIIHGRGWAVIESNAAFSSGIYGCDPGKVLQAFQHAGERLPQNQNGG